MPTQLEKQTWTREKVLKLHDRFMQGASLRGLGDENDLSHESVRQLFSENGLPTSRPKRQTLSRYAAEVEAWRKKDQIYSLYEEHGTVEDVVIRTGLPREPVATVINNMPLRQVYRRKGKPKETDRDKIIDSFREAAKVCGEPLTIPCYREHAPSKGWPADLTVIRAFGTWAAAGDAAGVQTNPSEGPRRTSITPDDCIASIRVCANELGRVPSYEQYVQWARKNKRPSGPTVRVKIGPWREALRLSFYDD